jgi:hypothetical protein
VPDLNAIEVLTITLIGLAAGLLGGLAGIGGSLVMIPGLALLLGYKDPSHIEHHVYMAAAMMVNALVAAPAAVRHHKAGAVRFDIARTLLPAMALFIIVGVLVSNVTKPRLLVLLLAIFIALVALRMLSRVVRRRRETQRPPERKSHVIPATIGVVVGFIAGLLGIGGGVLIVPALNHACRIPLRHAIGTSSAVMCITAVIGATFKAITLTEHAQPISEAFLLAALMGPFAMVGAWLGAVLTHTLPLPTVRSVIAVLLLITSVRMAGMYFEEDETAPAPTSRTRPD